MASIQELRRVVTIQGKTTGIKEAAGDLKKLDAAYSGVVVESAKLEKATLSVDRQFRSLQMRIDPAFRATERLAAAERTLNAAQAQGLITLARKNELLALAAVKSDAATAATSRSAAAMAGLTSMVSGLLGPGLLLALPFAVERAVSSVGDLADAAARAGVSAEKLQVLRFALEQTGGEAADADSALTKFTVGVGRLGTVGGGPAAAAMKALGVSVKDASGQMRKTDAIFDDVVDKLSRIESHAAVAGLAASIFGRDAGPKMATLLMDGTDALAEHEAELRRIGGLMSNETVAAADKLDDKFKELITTLSTFGKTVAVEAGGALDKTLNDAQRIASGIDEFVENPSLDTYLRVLMGDYAGALASLGLPVNQPNRGAKGNQLVPGTASSSDLGPTAAQFAAASASISQQMAGNIIPLTDEMRGRFVDAFGDGAAAASNFGKEVANIPLPKLRPEMDSFGKALDRAKGYATGFFNTFLGGLTSGEGLVSSLSKAVGDLTGQLGSDLLGKLGTSIGGSIGGSAGSFLGSILGPLGSALGSAAGSLVGKLFDSIFGDNGEEERLRRKEERQRRQEARERREAKLEQKEEERLARKESKERRREGFQDRAFFAGLDTSTLAGQLAEFDRQAQREREEELRAGGKAMGALEKALAAERLKIQQDFNDQAIEEAKRAADEMNRVARSIVDYVNGLNTSSDSPLSPTDRFAASQAAYQSQLALAQGGNLDAQSSITSYADAYLKAAREMYASSTAFQDIFAQVKSQLLGLPAVTQSTDPVVQALAAVQAAVQASTTAIAQTTAAVAGTTNAVNATTTALGPLAKDTSLTSNTNGLPAIAGDTDPLNASLVALRGAILGTNASGQIEAIPTGSSAKNVGGLIDVMVALNTNIASLTLANVATLTNDKGQKVIVSSLNFEKTKFWDPVKGYLKEIAKNTSPKGKVKTPDTDDGGNLGYFDPANNPNTGGSGKYGGVVAAMAMGGRVGNGIWNVDSVRARYALGGDIMLAGGEHVTRATSVNAVTLPILDAINRTGRIPDNDNGRYFADQNRVMLSIGRATLEALQRLEARLARIEAANNNVARAVERKPVAKQAPMRA